MHMITSHASFKVWLGVCGLSVEIFLFVYAYIILMEVLHFGGEIVKNEHVHNIISKNVFSI